MVLHGAPRARQLPAGWRKRQALCWCWQAVGLEQELLQSLARGSDVAARETGVCRSAAWPASSWISA